MFGHRIVGFYQNYPLVVFSVHAKLKGIPGGYVVPHLKQVFSDIMMAANEYQYFIIGGDLNASRRYDDVYSKPAQYKHRAFFNWLETELHLISVTGTEETQTMRGNSTHLYQNDHIYVNKNMRELLTNAQVFANDIISQLSDHNPVLAEFNLNDAWNK